VAHGRGGGRGRRRRKRRGGGRQARAGRRDDVGARGGGSERRSSGRRSGTADLRAALGDGGPQDWRRSAAVELGRRVLWWRGTAALRDNDGGEQEAVGAGDGSSGTPIGLRSSIKLTQKSMTSSVP